MSDERFEKAMKRAHQQELNSGSSVSGAKENILSNWNARLNKVSELKRTGDDYYKGYQQYKGKEDK